MNIPRMLSLCAAAGAALAANAASAASVSLPAGNHATLSPAVQGKIAFWLKGDANLVTNASGNVVAWCDAREAAVADEAAYAARVAAGSWTYPRAVVYTAGDCASDPVPVGASAPASFGGKPYVDFGEYHDNKWLLLVDAAGARKRVFGSGYAGYIGFGSTAGFVVGDVDNPDRPSFSAHYSGQNGVIHFHKGSGGNGDDTIFGTTARGHRGETRVDGRVVNPTTTKHVRNGWEIFLQNGPNISGNPSQVSTLFNACNFKAGCMEGLSSDPTSRQGGGKVAEIMLFSSMLTQDEAAAVEAYLRGRWQGGSGSAEDVVALAAADTLAANASSGSLFVGDVAGTGAIEKTGSGTLVIDRNGRLAAGPLAIREGKVETFGKRSHHAPLVAIGGKAVSASGSALAVSDDSANPDRFTLVETVNRRVPLAGAEAGVAKVAVSTARLLLQPPALPEASVATIESSAFMAQGNLIKNGSFEDTAAITHNNGQWQASVFPENWVASGRRNTANGNLGVTTTADTSAWLNYANPGEVADGSKAFFFQVSSATSTNGLQQTVDVPKTGLYEFSAFIRVRRRGGGDNSVPLWVLVDGNPILARRPWRIGYWDAAQSKFVTDGTATELKFKRVAVDVALSAGSHVIELLAVNHNGDNGHSSKTDRALIIDDVRLEPKAEGNFVAVADGSFSSCNYWSETEINSVDGGSLNRNYTPFWTFSGSSAYIVRYPTVWFWNPLYEGRGEDQAIALQNGNSASQTVTLPKAGRVRVTCRYANRSDNRNGTARPNGQTVSISLGGAVVASAVVTSQDMKVLVAEGEVSAGPQTLTLASSAVSGKDVATVIDDIRIEYVEDSPRIVSDTAFADNSASWMYSGAWAESDPYGLRELVFTNNASATLIFTAPSNGTYLLTFQTRGRPLSETGTDGVYHSYANYSHNLDVRLDGGFLANNYGEAATRHPVEIRLPYLTAGDHVLRFSGSCDAGVRETAQSRISDVTVTPLATGAMPDWSEMEFDLSSGAKIEADLGGTVKVKKLRVDGVSKIGEFTAANSDFVVGNGTIEVMPSTFMLIMR